MNAGAPTVPGALVAAELPDGVPGTCISQALLLEAAARRITAARPELAGRHDLMSFDGLLAAQRDIEGGGENGGDGESTGAGTGAGRDGDGDGGTLAAVVLRSVDLAAWSRATCGYALSLTPAQSALWRRSFTRTVFLAGNPEQLTRRFPFAQVADDLSAAWTSPGPAAETAALRRLLKLFVGRAALPDRPDTVIEVPGTPAPGARPPVHRGLYLATSGCTLAEALVHLNHVLAEAVLDGLIAGGDRLTLHQVPRLVGVPGRLAAVRVAAEHHLPGRLKAAAGLTEETRLV
ncbi:DUF6182 family protein [Streptomyces monticola]|uniref:DUF6182 family protein n=1 Tax=Streptomyces monticola TaxID=2666263 RepID=A0ABW2JVT6_9ACTN